MRAFPTALPFLLEWVQPKTFLRWFELRADDQLVATLSFETSLGTLAIAESAHGAWTFEQAGILDQRVIAEDADSEAELAIFYPNLMGEGSLELADGRSLDWKATNFWGSDWSFVDEIGARPIAFQAGVEKARLRDVFKTQATLAIEEIGWTPAELAFLAALGWYLILLHKQRTAGAAAAVTAAT